ncbi:hypothetical protein DESUT3_09770 [Desulfuromonas versatilis]|uniref:PilZ domain-containing protein n=1 Tax=Desulfuromonas versatilis TaxID=2802975 RepID=A0ABM8HT90_9BACT|nr:PilZ domain-containing protein [Desulfuromonas versatilis]BCR03908.1 hypothetical protein DESUT3_09770 [Desulfuromonas versatilis]
MRYPKYFKPGQKILIRPLVHRDDDRQETLTLYFRDGDESFFDLEIPYRIREGEDYPFTPQMPCELLSESFGLGLRLTGRFHAQQGRDRIRVEVNPDLEIYQRRQYPRIDIAAGLRYTKGRGELRTFRGQWEKNLRLLEGEAEFSRLRPFPRCQVNLSCSGIRIPIRPPVEVADLCLLFLEIAEGAKPICALAEVVWVGDAADQDRRTAGMRFIDILASDQKRIERLVREHLSASAGSTPEAKS